MFQKLNELRSSISNWINEKRSNQQDPENRSEENSGENPKTPNEGILKNLTEKLKKLQNATGERANQLAESLAKQISSWTGKEVTPDDVKKGARNGAIIGTIVAMFLVANKASTHSAANSVSQMFQGPRGSQGNTSSYGGSYGYPNVPAPQQSDEEFYEDIRVQEDHERYAQQEEQNQYFDQMQDVIDDQVSYNDY